jgi:hypothetical protein
MPTKITYQVTHLPPTQMWVDGRAAWDYEKMGWDIVEYEPPTGPFAGCYSGRALVRERGNGCDHTWSPELVALHKHVCKVLDNNHPPYKNRRLWNEFNQFHSDLFNTYHTDLCSPKDGECLEDVRDRIVLGIFKLASKRSGGIVDILIKIGEEVLGFCYE